MVGALSACDRDGNQQSCIYQEMFGEAAIMYFVNRVRVRILVSDLSRGTDLRRHVSPTTQNHHTGDGRGVFFCARQITHRLHQITATQVGPPLQDTDGTDAGDGCTGREALLLPAAAPRLGLDHETEKDGFVTVTKHSATLAVVEEPMPSGCGSRSRGLVSALIQQPEPSTMVAGRKWGRPGTFSSILVPFGQKNEME
ncbi:hypothetical protein VTK26DRAFT_2547 [Humicola hyalothermophila]